MRFMLMVYSGEYSGEPPLEAVQAMQRFNEELLQAGALLSADGLMPPSTATRLTFPERGGEPSITDGPFAEAKELIGGYWIIQAASQEEAVAWAARAPLWGGSIEVRRIGEPEDYSPEIAEASKLSVDPPEQTVAE